MNLRPAEIPMSAYYDDDDGYSGSSGFHGMGDLLDDINAGLATVNPVGALASAAGSAVANFVTGGGAGTNVVDPNSVANAGAQSDQQIAASMTPAGGFPSWAGSPAVFMGRIAKFNQVNGTGFAVNTSPLDPSLMAAVRSYQSSRGLSADGEMGPNTEAALDRDIASGGGAQPAPVPQNVSPVDPGQQPGGLNNASVTDASGDKTKLLIALGVGGVALLALAYYATK